MTQREDITDSSQSTSRLNLLQETQTDGLSDSRMIGQLLLFKNRDGRFVLLESLVDFLTNTKSLPGLDCFRIDQTKCLYEMRNPIASRIGQWLFGDGERIEWTFGDVEKWEADQCCGILALHRANWTAGKRIRELDADRWAISDRINRRLVICLPPEDFVATHEQTWEAVCEEIPWEAGPSRRRKRLIRAITDGSEKKILKSSEDTRYGTNEPEIDEDSGLPMVRKRIMAPQVAERYVRLSYLGDVLPWLREKAFPVAEAEDAGLAQSIEQCIAHIARRPVVLVDDGRVAAREAEIRRKIEIEIAFRHRLVAALDKEGFIVEEDEDGIMTDEQAKVCLQKKYDNEPDRTSMPWADFVIHAKDAPTSFGQSVRFLSDREMLVLPKRQTWEGVSWCDETQSISGVVKIIDARLRFESLPSPVMRAILLEGHLAEELASKVTPEFKIILSIRVDRDSRPVLTTLEDIQRVVREYFDLRVAGRDFMTTPRFEGAPRQIAMFLCRKLAVMTLPQIIKAFNRSRASVIYSCKAVIDRMRSEPKFRDTVIELVQKLGCKLEAVED